MEGRRRYTREGLAGQLARSGLTVRRLTHWNTLLLPLIAARRKLLPAPASGSDVRLAAPWLESSLAAVVAAETAWIRRLSNLPAGSSILAVAIR